MRTLRLITFVLLACNIGAQTNGRVSGRVADSNGRALECSITVVRSAGGLAIATYFTEAQGAFSFELPAGPAVFIAKASEHVSEERSITVRAGSANPEVRFALAAAGAVSGHVADAGGRGIPGAVVAVVYKGETRSFRYSEEGAAATTDPSGYFTIPAVARHRPFVLSAYAGDWLPASSAVLMLDSESLSGIQLLIGQRGQIVRGMVRDRGGAPAAGAELRLRVLPAGNELSPEERESPNFAAFTNRTALARTDGSFEFNGVPVGRVVVVASRGSLHGAVDTQVTPGRDVTLSLELR